MSDARNAVYSELMWPEWNPISESHGTSDAVADALLDAYRAEVLREAADRLQAIDPIEFALGSVDPIVELRRMAADTP